MLPSLCYLKILHYVNMKTRKKIISIRFKYSAVSTELSYYLAYDIKQCYKTRATLKPN